MGGRCAPQAATSPSTHDFPLVERPAAVGGGQGGRTLLQVPRLVAILGGAAHGDSVDAVCVAIARAVVPLSPAVPGCPDENGAQALPALGGKERDSASACASPGRLPAAWSSELLLLMSLPRA